MKNCNVKFSNNKLEFDCVGSHTVIEPWGRDSFRVRIVPEGSGQKSDWSLNIPQQECFCEGGTFDGFAFIRNGKIEARLSQTRINPCKVSFYKICDGNETLLLEEKDYSVIANAFNTKFFRPIDDELFYNEIHFEAQEDEKLFGMGQNETGKVNLKGCTIDLYQRHIKAPIPFVLSSRGYGFLWNNPSLGRVEFSNDRTRWVSYGCRQADYYITTGDEFSDIFLNYTSAVGRAPMLPYWASGFWQCKLRYKSQEEFLNIAREFKKREIPLSVLVIDYYHWDVFGNWQFDKNLWPDPEGMCQELADMGVKTIVSPWTLVSEHSKNYQYMKDNNMFTGSIDGSCDNVIFDGHNCGQYDPTLPAAGAFLWKNWKENYLDKGISSFWLDPCDEFHPIEQYDKVTYSIGKALECHSMFVVAHQKNVYDAMVSAGKPEVVNICRNAWVGSQRYGACTAPHDIECSFKHLKSYFKVGLNMMVSGIAWWNCDIGGFITDVDFNYTDEFFELMVRWYQWGVFMPIFRTHGWRENNEPWTIGGDTYPIICSQILLREKLRPYVMKQMSLVSEKGIPTARPLYFDYQADENCYEIEDELLFGSDILVAPILDYKVRKRQVYLPKGDKWIEPISRIEYNGGCFVECDAPINRIPVFIRLDSEEKEELIEIFNYVY